MSLRPRVLKSKLTVFGGFTFLMAFLAAAVATPPEPQLRITGAEVDCNAPAQLVLHGDFGEVLDTISLVLDLPAGPTGLWITDASPTRITAELQGCETPGTYRLTVGYGVDSDTVATTNGKVRPPQFYTVLDVTLGAVGPQGEQGIQGVPGPPGADGAPGVDGADGAPGADGSGWLTGQAPPDDTVGVDGDFYLQQGVPGLGDVFEKLAGAWQLVGNIRGDQGLQGDQGIQGPMGPAGADGSDGAAGADGLACWDLNENRTCDALDLTNPLNEDLNGDTVCTPEDCTGPQGPVGPQGPAGAGGADGLPGNLALAGMACPPGTFVTGFDLSGNLLCSGGTSTPSCGNSIKETGEECDDGNLFNGDGCSAMCIIELSACGNGTLEVGEECDDGNLFNGDGCSATCIIELSACGNGTLEVGEECDDGNLFNGDGCSATCTIETASPFTLSISAWADPSFVQGAGSDWELKLSDAIREASSLYESEFGLSFRLDFVEEFDPAPGVTDISAYLDAVTAARAASIDARVTGTDLTIALTNEFPPPGTVGLTWNESVCGSRDENRTSVVNFLDTPLRFSNLVAHQVGHSLGLLHVIEFDGVDLPGFVMSAASSTGIPVFHPGNIALLTGSLPGLTCLQD